MNKGHAVGCAALRNGVPCTCWVETKPLMMMPQPKIIPRRPPVVTPNGTIQQLEEQVAKLERQVHELTVEWRGLQDMVFDQRSSIIWLENEIAFNRGV